MDELTLLANALMALDDKLAACMKCGMCQSVCPVFGETMMEADVTRGKLTLLEKLAELGTLAGMPQSDQISLFDL